MKILSLLNYHSKSYKQKQQSFKSKSPDLITNYYYDKSCTYHKAQILKNNPLDVEKYFEKFGIDAKFKDGSEYAKKFVSYCCMQTAEIFNQLGHTLPVKVDLLDLRKMKMDRNVTGCSNFRNITSPKLYPIRSVIFNTFDQPGTYNIKGHKEPTLYNWDNFIEMQKRINLDGGLSTHHFLSPFIHEFAHNLHYHHLYSKFGCPERTPYYLYNPHAEIVLQRLELPLEQLNPYIGTQLRKGINEDISLYGASKLPETFAEAYTQSIVNHMDMFNLRLTSNPFAANNIRPEVAQVINETWEGAVGDGIGII